MQTVMAQQVRPPFGGVSASFLGTVVHWSLLYVGVFDVPLKAGFLTEEPITHVAMEWCYA